MTHTRDELRYTIMQEETSLKEPTHTTRGFTEHTGSIWSSAKSDTSRKSTHPAVTGSQDVVNPHRLMNQVTT